MTSNHTNHHSGGNFLQGFLLGLILGGAIVFLLGTEKGKKFLKVITDSGLDKVSDIDEFLEELSEGNLQDEEEEKPKLPAKSLRKKPVVNAYTKPVDIHPSEVLTVQKSPTVSVVGPTSTTPSKPRRFFRGVPKRT